MNDSKKTISVGGLQCIETIYGYVRRSNYEAMCPLIGWIL